MNKALAWVNAHRKFLVAAAGAVAVIGAEIPPDAPGWLTGTFSVLTAAAVWWVRNQPSTPAAERVHVEEAGYPIRPPDAGPELRPPTRRYPRVDRRGVDSEPPAGF